MAANLPTIVHFHWRIRSECLDRPLPIWVFMVCRCMPRLKSVIGVSARRHTEQTNTPASQQQSIATFSHTSPHTRIQLCACAIRVLRAVSKPPAQQQQHHSKCVSRIFFWLLSHAATRQSNAQISSKMIYHARALSRQNVAQNASVCASKQHVRGGYAAAICTRVIHILRNACDRSVLCVM